MWADREMNRARMNNKKKERGENKWFSIFCWRFMCVKEQAIAFVHRLKLLSSPTTTLQMYFPVLWF